MRNDAAGRYKQNGKGPCCCFCVFLSLFLSVARARCDPPHTHPHSGFQHCQHVWSAFVESARNERPAIGQSALLPSYFLLSKFKSGNPKFRRPRFLHTPRAHHPAGHTPRPTFCRGQGRGPCGPRVRVCWSAGWCWCPARLVVQVSYVVCITRMLHLPLLLWSMCPG